MKHIHFIGICGVAMSAIAIAFQKNGWKVTGSDAGFFPPISTELEKNKIDFYPGWHPEKMIQDGVPDLVVVGNVASSTNPEWLYVQEHKIPYRSYPEVIAEYFVQKNSIVCAGTYGKTSTAALLSFILTNVKYNPSYMFGGLAINEMDAARINKKKWSVLEGDEYKTSRWDNRPKFAHYTPTHLLLTGIAWDHMDVYPTEASYLAAFRDMAANVPASGILVANADDPAVSRTAQMTKAKIISYGEKEGALYRYTNLNQTPEGLAFDILFGEELYHIESPMLGNYQSANITGSFAMAHAIGIAPEDIIENVKLFKGMKRRLEKRSSGKIAIFDDIAHSPAKAKATLRTLRGIYKERIIAIFEPNSGNRERDAASGYDHAFDAADEVIIPRLTKIKQDKHDPQKPMDGAELTQVISRTHKNTLYFEKDEELIGHVQQIAQPEDVVVFLGSHGFRGMIEDLVTKLH